MVGSGQQPLQKINLEHVGKIEMLSVLWIRTQ